MVHSRNLQPPRDTPQNLQISDVCVVKSWGIYHNHPVIAQVLEVFTRLQYSGGKVFGTGGQPVADLHVIVLVE
jgi:hypothetical protein